MSDILYNVFNGIKKKLKDMGDGTHAEVIAEQRLAIRATKVLAVSGSSAQSATVGADTSRIVLFATVDMWIAIGSNPTAAVATAGSFFMAAGSQSYPIEVEADVTKIAAIQASSGGYLSIIESV